MRTDILIEIVVIVEKATGKNKVVYLSSIATGSQPLDLFVSETNRHIALYHQEAYADDELRNRRARNAMLYPGGEGEKMILVGQVESALNFDPALYFELSRAQLHLKHIPIDEL